jgi:hypothetical protein
VASEDEAGVAFKNASGPWTDLGLTLPIFVGYHLGVVLLPVRNAADVLTAELVALANNSLAAYGALTLAIAVVYVGTLVVAGRGHALHWERFVWVALEAVVYAVAMRAIAQAVVGELYLSRGSEPAFSGLVMSLGAGFYEEVMFRVILFGLGARLLALVLPLPELLRGFALKLGWAIVTGGLFSAWHYIGPLGDDFEVVSFAFRWVCGTVFAVIYWFRGFAPAVWTHALYDVWVLVF